MAQRPDPTERAARILAERGPEDRLDAFMMLTGQEYLWRTQGTDPLRNARITRYVETCHRNLPGKFRKMLYWGLALPGAVSVFVWR